MDSFWIYIIIAVVYALTRVFKKAAQPTDVDAPRPDREVKYDSDRPAQERPRQLTFEELLREITEAKQQAQRPAPPAPAKPAYEPVEAKGTYLDYDDLITDEEKSLEKVDYNDSKENRTYKEYDEGKRIAFQRPSLEETLRYEPRQVDYGKFKEFEVEEEPVVLDQYLTDIQDPEGWKKAVVMSEILNRRFQYW